MLEIDEKWNGKELELKPGQTFRLTLSENRTTGYSWHGSTDLAPVCSFIEDDFEGGNAIGAAGLHHWQFQAGQVGQTTLKLGYRRAWEQAETAGRSFLLHLKVVA